MKYVKQILKPGKYLVNTPTGERREEEFTPERTKHWADEFTRMRAAGLNIPAPWIHDFNAVPSPNVNTKDNAGFWTKLWTDPLGVLYGEVDVPNASDQEKIGTTVVEVSPYVNDWTDGANRSWKDAPLHIALVAHPIVPDQPNFVPVTSSTNVPSAGIAAGGICLSLADMLSTSVPTQAVALAYSDKMNDSGSSNKSSNKGSSGSSKGSNGKSGNPNKTGTDQNDEMGGNDASPNNASSASISDALNALRTLGLDLPDDTNGQNFVERVIVACRAINGQNQQEEIGEEEVKEQPSPVVLGGVQLASDPTPSQAGTPSGGQPGPYARATEIVQGDYARRINALIQRGVISSADAKKQLVPLVSGIVLSLEAPEIPANAPINVILSVLEKAAPGLGLNGQPWNTRPDSRQGKGVVLGQFEEQDSPSYDANDFDPESVVKQQMELAKGM